MNSAKENIRQISRKKFLNISASVIAGGSILGISGILLRKTIKHSGFGGISQTDYNVNDADYSFTSPYKLVSSFAVPSDIESFEIFNDKLIVAASKNIFIYDHTGKCLQSFETVEAVRDMAFDSDYIYILNPEGIEVFTHQGKLFNKWFASNAPADYCSIAITSGFIFVTDAENMNISKYTKGGDHVKFIQSPNGFVIPGNSFGIVQTNGFIYCINSGRHQVEIYTPEGDYMGAFGAAGDSQGLFSGCCNPVHLSYTPTGDIITSEKGNPRISCYSSDGNFRSILLNSENLGGGNTAYNVKINNDKLYVTGGKFLSTYQYDKQLASRTACSGCAVNCPLKTGII